MRLTSSPGQLVSNWTANQIFVPSAKIFATHEYHWGSVDISNIDIIITVAAIVVAAATHLWVSHTRQGRGVTVARVRADDGSLMGVNVRLLAMTTHVRQQRR